MRRTILLFVAGVLALVMVAPAATAAPPTAAAGGWTWEITSWDQVETGSGIVRFTGTEASIWTGTFSGSSVDSFRGVLWPNDPNDPNDDTLWALLNLSFTGSVNGVEGTMLIRTTAWAKALDQPMRGQWVILRGTGGLANLRGQGTWYADAAGGHYSGQVKFAS